MCVCVTTEVFEVFVGFQVLNLKVQPQNSGLNLINLGSTSGFDEVYRVVEPGSLFVSLTLYNRRRLMTSKPP